MVKVKTVTVVMWTIRHDEPEFGVGNPTPFYRHQWATNDLPPNMVGLFASKEEAEEVIRSGGFIGSPGIPRAVEVAIAYDDVDNG